MLPNRVIEEQVNGSGKWSHIAHFFICSKEIQKNLYYETFLAYTVKPVYSGHLGFLKKVSAITRCPLYRGF